MLCQKCGSQMLLDDQDELRRGVFKYWFACDRCGSGCTLNGATGETYWDDSEKEDDLPF
ncbi:MAG: hypothetical protein IKJ04_06295 [Clostridia bacterium]|nr:hypothetical protein [Clostridia bacterium]MBR4034402.1 hypothetical protein [Clostridia bacterium]